MRAGPVVALAGLALVGCESPPLEYREVTRIDEPVTAAELEAFVRIVNSLPGRRLPELGSVYAPPPDWPAARTLPVSDLVHEEFHAMEARWSVADLAEPLRRNRPLQRSLARERLSTEQFVGLALALGVALSRSSMGESHDLRKLAARGNVEIDRLRSDHRSFASLSDEARHSVLQRAAWITRRGRAQRLGLVPSVNLDLARRRREWLVAAFPAEFSRDPFEDIVDWLDERGVPFEEIPATGTDAELEWSRETAIIGRDPPATP